MSRIAFTPAHILIQRINLFASGSTYYFIDTLANNATFYFDGSNFTTIPIEQYLLFSIDSNS